MPHQEAFNAIEMFIGDPIAAQAYSSTIRFGTKAKYRLTIMTAQSDTTINSRQLILTGTLYLVHSLTC
jgi:hypothetical protein